MVHLEDERIYQTEKSGVQSSLPFEREHGKTLTWMDLSRQEIIELLSKQQQLSQGDKKLSNEVREEILHFLTGWENLSKEGKTILLNFSSKYDLSNNHMGGEGGRKGESTNLMKVREFPDSLPKISSSNSLRGTEVGGYSPGRKSSSSSFSSPFSSYGASPDRSHSPPSLRDRKNDDEDDDVMKDDPEEDTHDTFPSAQKFQELVVAKTQKKAMLKRSPSNGNVVYGRSNSYNNLQYSGNSSRENSYVNLIPLCEEKERNDAKTDNEMKQISDVSEKVVVKNKDAIKTGATVFNNSNSNSNHNHLVTMEPLARAPDNVFLLKDIITKKEIGWRNSFSLEMSYDVEFISDIFNIKNDLMATKHIPSDNLNTERQKHRRFIVIDDQVNLHYRQEMDNYFKHWDIDTQVLILPGEEPNKRYEAVDKILEELTIFKLRRREPIVAIGGGVILDIVGMAANMYRRGVPFIRVPTTLLAIVDASVGVKNGVDYDSKACGCQKNRIGSFYAPCGAFLDKKFISTQNSRNIINGFGEIMKLALVRSEELFDLLENEGKRMVEEKFQSNDGVSDRIIELSIQIMLEELGPNLWEFELERCVDFGHTFSKIMEMIPGIDLMHGEAVNIDGLLCVIISWLRHYINQEERDRIFQCMLKIGLPTWINEMKDIDMLYKGLMDAVEHRHGKQRVPLITGIGKSVCVNDITREEVKLAVDEMVEMHNRFHGEKLHSNISN